MTLHSTIRRGVNAVLSMLPMPMLSGRILLYHHIGDGSEPSMYVPSKLFRRQVDWLSTFGLRGVTVSEAVDAGFPDGMIAITFDDGYSSALEACDVLANCGWRATLFVVPNWCDGPRAGSLTWATLRELADAGFEVGAHGLDHSILVGESELASLRRARDVIEQHVGTKVRGLSYPHGIATREARAGASRVFDYACTTEPRRNGLATAREALGRNEVISTDTTPRLLRGKLGGSDDWMATVRAAENRVRYGS